MSKLAGLRKYLVLLEIESIEERKELYLKEADHTIHVEQFLESIRKGEQQESKETLWEMGTLDHFCLKTERHRWESFKLEVSCSDIMGMVNVRTLEEQLIEACTIFVCLHLLADNLPPNENNVWEDTFSNWIVGMYQSMCLLDCSDSEYTIRDARRFVNKIKIRQTCSGSMYFERQLELMKGRFNKVVLLDYMVQMCWQIFGEACTFCYCETEVFREMARYVIFLIRMARPYFASEEGTAYVIASSEVTDFCRLVYTCSALQEQRRLVSTTITQLLQVICTTYRNGGDLYETCSKVTYPYVLCLFQQRRIGDEDRLLRYISGVKSVLQVYHPGLKRLVFLSSGEPDFLE